jgi:hypothetical protein
MTSAFYRLASVTASAKRAVFASGKQGDPVTHVTSLKCTPLDPVSDDAIRRLNLNTPGQLLETYVEQPVDIIKGDRLVVDGKEYPVRAVAPWVWKPGETTYLHLVLDDLEAAE